MLDWSQRFGTAADVQSGGATLSKLLRLYVQRNVSLWKDFTKVEWLANTAVRLLRSLEEGDRIITRLRLTLAVARDASYGAASRAVDEFGEADPADFSPELPAQMPADEADDGDALFAGRREHRGALQQPVGRLVVPLHERLQLESGTNPLLQFFLSFLPWAMPPPRPADRNA